MELVAHGNGLGNENVKVDATLLELESRGEDGAEHVAHPAQAIDDFLGVGAKAQHLADALVHGAVAHGTVNAVLDHDERHILRGDAAHGAHGVDMVARNELDLAALEQLAGVGLVVGPLLKEDGTDAGALHGVGHVAVLDRRTGMEDDLAVDLGDEVLSRTDVHQKWLRGAEALDNAIVLLIDLVVL